MWSGKVGRELTAAASDDNLQDRENCHALVSRLAPSLLDISGLPEHGTLGRVRPHTLTKHPGPPTAYNRQAQM